MKLADWNMQMAAKVIADFPKLSRETRIFLSKCMMMMQDLQKERTHAAEQRRIREGR